MSDTQGEPAQKKLTIWIVNQYAYTPSENAGTRHFSFARGLREAGHDAHVVSSSFYHKGRRQVYLADDGPVLKGDVDGVPYVWLRTPAYTGNISRLWNMSVFGARLLLGQASRHLPRPDVIMSTSPSPLASAAALLLARRFRCKHVLEVVDIWPATLRDVSGLSGFHPLYAVLRTLERALYQGTDAIITHLGGAREHFVASGANPQKCHYLPSPIPFADIPPHEPPPAGDRFRFIHAGAMTPSYALDQILDAVDIMVAEDPNAVDRFSIDFVGEGVLMDQLQARVDASGYREVVHFRGTVAKADILTVLAEADGFLVVSKDLDVHRFGVSFNKIFDSMLVGRPIILANRAKGTPVERAQAGIIVEPEAPAQLARAMTEMMAWQPDERERVGRANRNYVLEHHSLKGWVEQLMGVLKGLGQG